MIVLDRMLPELDGLAMLRTMRAADVKTPVLLLTALGGIDDRVEGLEAGGDDYLVKPFAFAELLARVNALARRPPPQDMPTTLRVADLEMDLLRRTVTRGGRRIDLQPREFQLLEYLMRHAGEVVTRTMLLESGLGLPLRPQDQHRRDPHQPPARQDRPRPRPRPDPYACAARAIACASRTDAAVRQPAARHALHGRLRHRR